MNRKEAGIATLHTEDGRQVVRLPKGMGFSGVTEVEALWRGASIILTPKRKDWRSYADAPKADKDFLAERPDIVETGRVRFD